MSPATFLIMASGIASYFISVSLSFPQNIALVIAALSAISTSLYLIPTEIAFFRGASARWAIAFCNLVLGWTLLGWLICLIWGCEGHKGGNRNVKWPV